MDQEKRVRPIMKLLLVVIVLAIGAGVMGVLVMTPVEAEKSEKEQLVPLVEYVVAEESSYTIEISAQGQVEPVTQTAIVSEVSGALEYVSPELKRGGLFEKNEVMVRVSKADYQAQLEQARSSVADAELQIAQEEARAEQSMRDWKKLGRGGEPSALIKREPQLKSARARLAAAKANVVQSERDLARTEVKAPYDCLVAETSVDQGGYIVKAGRVAEIYSAGKVKVRIPLSLEDFTYLPENAVGLDVLITSNLGNGDREWTGKVVRTEGTVDRATHTMMTVVELESNEASALPPTGLFVKGTFKGVELANAVLVPRESIRKDETVWVINDKNQLDIREVQIERSEREVAVVTSGLGAGDRVITSPIELPIKGMKLKALTESSED